MQDSLEDYIKISKNVKPENIAQISKEVQITAQLKQECEARAFKIVEMSIDGKLKPEVFTRCLPFINQLHYQDIVEERAITKLCGYSICGKKIPDMPNKHYFISTKSNKVYDITERKNFCSNFCYKASLHIKNQIDNSPLWMRKLDDIPEYSLLHTSEGGLPGELIDQGIVKKTLNVEPNFTSISSFANISLNEIVEKEINPKRAGANSKNSANTSKKSKTSKFVKSSRILKNTMQTITENDVEFVEEDVTVSKEVCDTKKCGYVAKVGQKKDNHVHAHKKPNNLINLPAIEENDEKLTETQNIEDQQNPQTDQTIKENHSINTTPQGVVKKKTKKQKQSQSQSKSSQNSSQKILLDIENIIKNSLNEWLTLETYIFIHGEQKVKEILDEKKLGDYFEALKISELQMEQQTKYMEICRRLQLQEMADEKFDEALVGNTKLKPPPDYKKLKEESKDLNIKVKSFYTGTVYEKEDTNFPTKVNSKNEEITSEECPPAVLPLVDVNSQNVLRRKIFLSSINKAMQQLLQSLGVRYFSTILSDVQSLVKTFKLGPDNIIYKPVVWNYISLVLLHILSVREQNIKLILEEKRSQEFVTILLNSLPNKSNFISNIFQTIENIESFVENYITRKTDL